MRKTYLKKLPAYQFHQMQKFSDQVEHAVFGREGGVSMGPFNGLNVRFGVGDKETAVKKNRELICEVLGIKGVNLISADQTHSKNVLVVDEDSLAGHSEYDERSNTDALITNFPGAALMIQVADCQAILMYDQGNKAIAAIHAGWKGLKQDISGATVRMMKKHFGTKPENILVGIAPSLGPCCSFFSNPEKELPKSFHKYIDRQKRVDLWAFSLQQLQESGIKKENIELSRVCTQCGKGGGKGGKGRFFSFRAQLGITGRFGAVIMLR